MLNLDSSLILREMHAGVQQHRMSCGLAAF
jgi:hypothetical protein